MRTVNTPEMNRIKEAVEESFFDKCTIDVYSESTDTFGDIQKTWLSGSEIACGFEATSGKKQYKDQTTIQSYDAKVRLPLSTQITDRDKVTVRGIQYQVQSIKEGLSLEVELKKLS